MNPAIKPISAIHSFLLFAIPSAVFVVICQVLIPALNESCHLHPALSWFIGGLLVFLPLFLIAIYWARKDGFKTKV